MKSFLVFKWYFSLSIQLQLIYLNLLFITLLIWILVQICHFRKDIRDYFHYWEILLYLNKIPQTTRNINILQLICFAKCQRHINKISYIVRKLCLKWWFGKNVSENEVSARPFGMTAFVDCATRTWHTILYWQTCWHSETRAIFRPHSIWDILHILLPFLNKGCKNYGNFYEERDTVKALSICTYIHKFMNQ